MTILAKTRPGYEYMYTVSSAHAVPTSSAEKIRDTLNRVRYKLCDGETWHIYTGGWYEMNHTAAAYQVFYIRYGKIRDVIR